MAVLPYPDVAWKLKGAHKKYGQAKEAERRYG